MLASEQAVPPLAGLGSWPQPTMEGQHIRFLYLR